MTRPLLRLFGVEPVFVGRSNETAVLQHAIEALAIGDGGFIHLVGEAGIGKTSLLVMATDDLARRAITVRAAAADETDRRRHLSLVRALLPEAGWRTEPDPVGAAVAEVERLAAAGPVALLADDVHWADDASLDAIRAIARRAAVLGMLVVTTARSHPPSASLSRLGETAASSGQRLALGPLDGDQLELLVERRFGSRPGPNLALSLATTAGNPFLAVEFVGALVADGLVGLDNGVIELEHVGDLPEDLSDRLARHTLLAVPEGELVLRAAAVLPGGFTTEELAAVLDRPLTEVLAIALAAVTAAVLVDTGSTLAFRHELLRRAVLESTPPSIVRTLQRLAAAVLVRRHADPERVTTCLLAGCDPNDPHDVEQLLAAGRDMHGRNPAAAADLLRAGLDGLPAHDERFDATSLELGWALLAAGRPREISAVLDARRRRRSGRLLIEEHRLRGIAMSLSGRIDELADRVDVGDRAGDLDASELAATLDPTDPDAVDAAAEMGLLWVSSERPDEARRVLDWVAASPTPSSPFRVASVSTVRAWLAAVNGSFEDAVVHARAGLDAVALDGTGNATPGSPMTVLALAHDFLGDGDAALAVLRESRHSRPLPRWTPPLLQFATALTLYRRGDWDDALAEVDAGLLAADEVDLGLGVFWPYGVGTLIAVARGQREAAQQWLVRSRTLLGTRSLGAEWLGFATAAQAEADGDDERAAAVLEHIANRVLDANVPTLLLNVGADTVRLAIATHRTGTAERVVAALHALTTRTSSPVARAVADWSAGLARADPHAIASASDLLADCRRIPDATKACHDAAVVAARNGDESEARRHAKEAFAGYDALGADQLHLRLRSELRTDGLVLRPRRTPPRPAQGWASLTPSESTIVQLVSEGLTNTEIGERLYVSRRTVESHLGRVYAKLDLSTRAQLVAAAMRHPFA